MTKEDEILKNLLWPSEGVKFYKDGPELRSDVLRMAFKSQANGFTIRKLISDAQELINWINGTSTLL